jgi:hypothetical protein
MALVPAAVAAALLALGLQNFDQCFNKGNLTFPAALSSAVQGVAHPVGLIGIVSFVALAAIWASRSNRKLSFALWMALMVLMVAALWPASGQHDCDRKGTDAIFRILVMAVPGLVAVWIALWNSRPRKTQG